jgi:hypothetical protein
VSAKPNPSVRAALPFFNAEGAKERQKAQKNPIKKFSWLPSASFEPLLYFFCVGDGGAPLVTRRAQPGFGYAFTASLRGQP